MIAAPASARGWPAKTATAVVLCPPSILNPQQIQHACSGDRSALATLVEALLPIIKVEVAVALRRKAAAAGRDARQELDDLVQDVLLHLLDNSGRVLRRWDPERGRSLASFVRLVTRHRIARTFEGFRGNPWSTQASEEETLEALRADRSGTFRRIASRSELRRVLDALRARLDERGLALFQMIYVEQRPIREVCTAMNMSRAAVDQWTSRLRKRIRDLAKETS